jgi:hypothetical protein
MERIFNHLINRLYFIFLFLYYVEEVCVYFVCLVYVWALYTYTLPSLSMLPIKGRRLNYNMPASWKGKLMTTNNSDLKIHCPYSDGSYIAVFRDTYCPKTWSFGMVFSTFRNLRSSWVICVGMYVETLLAVIPSNVFRFLFPHTGNVIREFFVSEFGPLQITRIKKCKPKRKRIITYCVHIMPLEAFRSSTIYFIKLIIIIIIIIIIT